MQNQEKENQMVNSRTIKFRAWDKLEKKFIGEYRLQDYRFLSQAYHQNLEYSQYTGLKDNKKKNIYEGDIVNVGSLTHSSGIEVVKYKDGGFHPFAIPGWEGSAEPKDCKIIGNIYENPELIK